MNDRSAESVGAQLTDRTALEQKSLGMQVGRRHARALPAVLVLQYGQAARRGANLTPIFGIIPVLNFVCAWQIADAAEAVTDQDKEILFILFLVFGVLSWYWIQSGVNQAASR